MGACVLTAALSFAQGPVPATGPQPGFHYELNARNDLRIYHLDGTLKQRIPSPGHGWVFGELAKPLPGGRILALVESQGTPKPKKLVEMDSAGNILWEFDPSPFGVKLHHDFERLANGNTLLIGEIQVPVLPGLTVADDLLVEVDPMGRVVWLWSCLANIAQMPVSPSGWLSLVGRTSVLFHTNSIHALPANPWSATDPRFKPGNVMVSFRELNLVLIIDRGTGLVVWSLYNVTLGQHHARMIELGTPGEGNILLFDNGGSVGAPLQPFRGYSRVLEIDPPSSSVVWEYACTPASPLPSWCSTEFFAPFRASAQRLSNGNTLIANSATGTVFEVTPAKQAIWQTTQASWLYRGYRWPLDWESPAMARFPW